MVKINCASIPATLIENELFGREKGAYTGAYKQQIGRFEMADGSTLFLDEISELPLELQAKLLRILQEKKFERIGGTRTISVDVRIIAATNQNLLDAVNKGKFRQDLFYRLNVFPIRVPTLTQRMEDIPLLVDAFVKEFGETMAKRFTSVSSKSMNAMMRYSWPGNIRELRNVIERGMIMSSGRILHIKLPKHDLVDSKKLLLLDDVIRNHIIEILNMTSWKVSGKSGAAKAMGLPPSTLQSKMKKLGITRKKKELDIG
jgi:transcriptional regulator with GAF, ATPase, and Fis domain